MIPQTFIETAGDILGSAEKGLSGPKIASLFAAYAVDYNTDIDPCCQSRRTKLGRF